MSEERNVVVPSAALCPMWPFGCCDSSPNQHGRKHVHETGHPLIRSFEPGEAWFWSFETESQVQGEDLAPPESRPADQPAPGPEGKVPPDWQSLLNQ